MVETLDLAVQIVALLDQIVDLRTVLAVDPLVDQRLDLLVDQAVDLPVDPRLDLPPALEQPLERRQLQIELSARQCIGLDFEERHPWYDLNVISVILELCKVSDVPLEHFDARDRITAPLAC